MPASHFTYRTSPDLTQLKQGDILEKTVEIQEILRHVHPHYLNADYKYLIVLTQTCDLERRSGNKVKAQYITLAAVRPLETLIYRELSKYKNDILEKGKIIDTKNRIRVNDFFVRLLNNNEPNYFYLNKDLGIDFEDNYVAFLRLSIAIKVEHYDACLKAKRLELRDEFKGKLGWLVGNIYSRIGTRDWNEKEIKEEVKKILTTHCIWVNIKGFKYELMKKYPLEEIKALKEEELEQKVTEIKIPNQKERVMEQINNILEDVKFITDPAVKKKLLSCIKSHPGITTILSGE